MKKKANQTNTGGLPKLFKIIIDAKVILTVNVDIQDCLINGQTGSTRHTEFAHGNFRKVYGKISDEQDGLKVMKSSYFSRQNSWVPIEKCESEIPIKEGLTSQSIRGIQISLTLGWTSTFHEV